MTRTPACPHFGICGGCSFQHIEYTQQLENKRRILSDLLGTTEFQVVSGEEFSYRNRVDLIFHQDGIGFREKGKWWQGVDVEICAISNQGINDLLKEIRQHFSDTTNNFDLKKKTGTLRYAVIRATKLDSSICFVLNKDSSRLQDAVDKIYDFLPISSCENILIAYIDSKSGASVSENFEVVKGSKFLKEQYLGKTFYFDAQGFLQTNSEMAEQLQTYCHNLIKGLDLKHHHLLDLYGGVGTFGALNANLFDSVLTIECVASCIECANENIRTNDIHNMKAQVLDAKRLKQVSLPSPLFVINDPPRSGMNPKTITTLNSLEPEYILYISCNPKQLSIDLAKFPKYEVKDVALFDLFPQTPHMEVTCLLQRKSEKDA